MSDLSDEVLYEFSKHKQQELPINEIYSIIESGKLEYPLSLTLTATQNKSAHKIFKKAVSPFGYYSLNSLANFVRLETATAAYAIRTGRDEEARRIFERVRRLLISVRESGLPFASFAIATEEGVTLPSYTDYAIALSKIPLGSLYEKGGLTSKQHKQLVRLVEDGATPPSRSSLVKSLYSTALIAESINKKGRFLKVIPGLFPIYSPEGYRRQWGGFIQLVSNNLNIDRNAELDTKINQLKTFIAKYGQPKKPSWLDRFVGPSGYYGAEFFATWRHFTMLAFEKSMLKSLKTAQKLKQKYEE